MNSLLRIAIASLGIYWILSGLHSSIDIALRFLGILEPMKRPDSWSILSAAATVAVVAVTYVAPSLLLIRWRAAIADRIVPPTEVSIDLRARELFLVGCSLLAIVFLVDGVGTLVSGIGTFFAMARIEMPENSLVYVIRLFSSSSAKLLAALFLFWYAKSRAIPRAA